MIRHFSNWYKCCYIKHYGHFNGLGRHLLDTFQLPVIVDITAFINHLDTLDTYFKGKNNK